VETKKAYMQPVLNVEKVEIRTNILYPSVTGINSNAGLRLGGGGNGPARSRSHNDWFDDEGE
jgi:hypothetical protein